MVSEAQRDDGRTEHVYSRLPYQPPFVDDAQLIATHKKRLVTRGGPSRALRKKKKDPAKASASSEGPPPTTVVRRNESNSVERSASSPGSLATSKSSSVEQGISRSRHHHAVLEPLDQITSIAPTAKPRSRQYFDESSIPRLASPIDLIAQTPQADGSFLQTEPDQVGMPITTPKADMFGDSAHLTTLESTQQSIFQQPGMNDQQSNAFVFEATAPQQPLQMSASAMATAHGNTIPPFAPSSLVQGGRRRQLQFADMSDEHVGAGFED